MAKPVRKKRRKVVEEPKQPQKATFFSGSLKPTVSRARDAENRKPLNTQCSAPALLTLPPIAEAAHSAVPSTSAPESPLSGRESDGVMSPAILRRRAQMPTLRTDVVSEDYSDTDYDTDYSPSPSSFRDTRGSPSLELPALVEPGTGRARVFFSGKAKSMSTLAPTTPTRKAETEALVKGYKRLAQTAPRKPKWENDEEDELDPSISPSRTRGVKKKDANGTDSAECPKRVMKLLGSLRDLRQEMHDVTEKFESVIINEGVMARSVFANEEDKGDVSSKVADGSSKKLKVKLQQLRSMHRISVQNRAGMALGAGLKSHYFNVMAGGSTGKRLSANQDPIDTLARSHKVPYQVVKRIVELYHSVDYNKDGTVNKANVESMVKQLPGTRRENIEDVWDELDMVGTGGISLHEFIEWFVKKYGSEWKNRSPAEIQSKFSGTKKR